MYTTSRESWAVRWKYPALKKERESRPLRLDLKAGFVDVRAGENQCKQAQAYLLASFLTGRPHFRLVVNLTVNVAIGDAVAGWVGSIRFCWWHHEVLEAPSKKEKCIAVGLRSIASACNSFILDRCTPSGSNLKSSDLPPCL